MNTQSWVGMFSGGKDSTYALQLARERGLAVDRLLSVQPPDDATMFHVPGTDVLEVVAEVIGLPMTTVAFQSPTDQATTAIADQGDAELAELEPALEALVDRGHTGVIVGAVESRFQGDRIESLCQQLGLECFAPLWQADPIETLEAMVAAGLEIKIVEVAAEGLDRSWLGSTITPERIDQLETLAKEYGVHPLGEGGEYETFVVDGPHLETPLSLEATPRWHGTWGQLEISNIVPRSGTYASVS